MSDDDSKPEAPAAATAESALEEGPLIPPVEETAQGVDNRFDALGAVGFVGIGLLFIGLAVAAPKSEFTHDAIGPWAIPVGLAVVLIALGLTQAIRSLRFFRRVGRIGPHEGAEDEPGYPVIPLRAIGFIATCLVYPLLIPVLGFLPTTLVVVAGGLWALHFRRPVPLVIATIVFTAAMYFLFVVVLSIRLPSGFLGWP